MDPKAEDKKDKANADEGDTSDAGTGEKDKGESKGDGKEKFVTAEELSETLNKAITGHLKRLPKGITAEDLVKLLDDREAKAKSAAARKTDNDGEKAAETVQLQQRLDAMDKQLREQIERNQKYERDQRNTVQNGVLAKALEAGNVGGVRLKAAMHYLRAEGLVRESDAGELIFVDTNKDEVDLGKGIVKWLNTPDGKEFVPASGAKGAGSGSGRGGTPSKDSESDKDIAVIREFLGGAIQ